MYSSSRGSNAYGQQSSYAAQQAYGQNVGGPAEGSSQLSLSSRHSSMLGGGGPQDAADVGGYRAHPSAATHYGGQQYGAVYGSSSQQVAAMSGKGAGSSALQGRSGYASAMEESPKFASGDYVSSSSHGYGQKGDQFSSGKLSDYSSLDRRHYGEPQSGAFIGRDLQSDATRRYADSVSLGHQHQQPDMYDHLDQVSLLRQQVLLKSQSLQSASLLDGGARPTDYLAVRGAPIRHATQDLSSYGGRVDADSRTLSMLSGSNYAGQPQSSILGAAPRRNADDLMYAQGSSTTSYGVSLPPGRDYATGKGLHGTTLDSDYPSLMSRGGGIGASRLDERKDDRGAFRRELEIREEERRRDHVREREKEHEREKDRERERERERERLLERRDKVRERERKRVPEIRRERTPPRISRDRHGSSLGKEERPLRRDSSRQEALHRRPTPVKEKRREYICKVFPSCLVDVERDYLSLNKRYPKLSISPDFSKVVLNWPREMDNLKLSFHTPVSFEHDLVEVDSYPEQKKASSQSVNEQPGTSKCGATVWNAKVILMSGISRDALEELSSDKSYDDRIPHFNNLLRFAFLRENRAFIAIGGPQDVVEDASVDDSSLIKTALSYTKDLTQLDLQKCQNWNRFLEIHYDRVGKDGLYSHKEITVLYVPDLSECLPSLNAWRDQWLAQKKSVAERERRIVVEREKKSSEKDIVKERSQTKSAKDTDSPKKVKTEGSVSKLGKEEKKEARGPSSEQAIDGKKLEKDGTNVEEKAGDEMKGVRKDKKVENPDEGEGEEDRKNAEKKESEETSTAVKAGVQKPGKKKIVKKVVKQKVADKKAVAEGEKSGGEKEGKSESTPQQQDETSVDPAGVRTFTRKKIVKKVLAGKVALKENKSVDLDATQTESKSEKGVECQEDKPKDTIDPSSDSVQAVGVNTSGKKKIIKRVPKRKVTEVDDKGGESANNTKDGNTDEKKVTQKVTDAENSKEQAAGEVKPVVEAKKSGKKTSPKTMGKPIVAEKQEDVVNTREKEIKDEKVDKKETMGGDEKGTKKETKVPKEKGSSKDSNDGKSERLKDDKEKKDKTGKDESRYKSSREVKEREKPEEPPKQPGLILQTKGSKESKIRSMSLSLDALLDYNDKDIEESTFELSLFAESLYEMLQFQMGCRLLTFLQKLRIIFLKKRNQRKRERDEKLEKESEKEKSSQKRSKTTEASSVVNESAKSSAQNVANPDHEDAVTKDESAVAVKKEDASADEDNDSKMDNEEADDYDPEEDVEEDPEEDDDEDAEEDQEMEPSSPQNDTSKEAGNEVVMTDAEANPEKEVGDIKDETKESAEGDKTVDKSTETGDNSNAKKSKGKEVEGETEKKAKPVKQEAVVDKELLQAFRFFDRNRVGYVKVEDLRLIIHNLGKFLPHRVVKELVQSALLESNTARDNHILYNKLVRMANI